MSGAEDSYTVSEQETESEASSSEAPSERSKAKVKRCYSSRSSRAGLLFPVSRVERHLRRGHFAKRFAANAPVYLAAVMQCVTHKLLDVAGEVAKKSNQRRISPSHLKMAVQKSSALKKLLQDSMLRHCGRAVLQSERVAPLSRKKMSKKGKSSRPRAARAYATAAAK
ncbi:histone H2A-beta, sperm [Cuculus canorus]|uniref:histone H2A-beta, sperm n=1 Tax=Cuculus canorus TaxID=55661 RepID=UPI0023AAB4ED|nr:histone H2A-beta, sperm [Cuculus canorus]